MDFFVKVFSLLIFFGLGAFTIFLLFLFQKRKEERVLKGSMNLVLFSVSLLERREKEEQTKKTIEDYLKAAEQFYSSLAGLKKEKGFLKKSPYFIFEIAFHKDIGEIQFYFACSRDYAQLMEKEILAFWPNAQIRRVRDYNIFNPRGFSSGSCALLSKSKILPLKPLENFKVDPLSSITNVFTKLDKEKEGAALQIIFKPSPKNIKSEAGKVIELLQKGQRPDLVFKKGGQGSSFLKTEAKAWADALFGASSSKEKEQEKEVISPKLTPIQEEMISRISQKANEPLFDVNIRIIVSSGDKMRSKIILEQFKAAFEQFNSPFLNSFKILDLYGRKLKKLLYKFSFRIFDSKRAMLLSSSEMAGLFHFPNTELATPYVSWLKSKQAPPPANLPESGLLIGKNVFRGKETKIYFKENDRLRHFYIIGQTGTGKSALLLEMVEQDIKEGKGVALIDPHGDLAEKILALIPAARAEDVVYFNPADTELPLGLNMLEFDPHYPESKTFVANELLEIFEKLYSLKQHGFGGPMFEQYMRNAILLVMEDPQSGSTLIEIPRVLSDADFRRYKLSKCGNIIVKNFWEKEAEKAGGEAALANMVPYITSKLNIFIANDLVRPIVAQQKSSIDFREVMDKGKILIVNLAKGKLGDTNSFLLGMIIVGKILMAAFSRAEMPEEKRKNFFLYIDEFHNVTTRTIADILAEARKYRLGMIFAHQFIGQLAEETKKAVFGNVGSMLVFRVGPDDAKYLITQFEPVFDEGDLVNLDNFNAVLRLLIDGETSKPFNIITYPPNQGNEKMAELIKELSRKTYGRKKDFVEMELSKRLEKRY